LRDLTKQLFHVLKNITILEQLGQIFWNYVVIYANYLHNQARHSEINNKTPNEIFFNKKININHIWMFGCIANYFIENNNINKINPKSKKEIIWNTSKLQIHTLWWILKIIKYIMFWGFTSEHFIFMYTKQNIYNNFFH